MIDANEIEQAHAKLLAALPSDMDFAIGITLQHYVRPERESPRVVYSLALHHECFWREDFGEVSRCHYATGEDLDRLTDEAIEATRAALVELAAYQATTTTTAAAG